MDLDEIDRRLLNLLQAEFPLAPRPFAGLGERLGLSEEEVLERVRRLKAEKIIRQISAIFDSRALGYRSTLAAFQVPDDRLEQVATAVSQNQGVSHNYARNHFFNLWFTLTVPPGEDPQAGVESLARENSVSRFLYLPTLRVFKVAVQFDMVGMEGQSRCPPEKVGSAPEALGIEVDPVLVRQLQKDLELVQRPFLSLAEAAGTSEESLLETARLYQGQGAMRRFAAVLHHRKAGFSANGMGVWAVPQERVEEVGLAIAAFPQVTHCYQRPSYRDWPYSVFSMIHSRTVDGCWQVTSEISLKTGIQDYNLLFSTKEYKKARVKYYED
ncbi:MAG: AsnC family transcriptional regulator [Dehalococcoidia bacterium]|nr:AsnC family transcriptional regulator [Dehalococcoidia bacterium]